jgi:hypothetical protein
VIAILIFQKKFFHRHPHDQHEVEAGAAKVDTVQA